MDNKNTLITIKEINVEQREEWDKYLTLKVAVAPYLQFAWSETIQKAYGHEHFNIAAFQNDKIVGILPLIFIKPPFIKGSMCSLPFCDIGGCIADSFEIEEALLLHAKNITLQYKASQLQLRVSGLHTDKIHEPKLGQKVSMLLNLPSDSDTLFSGFKSKLRSQIRKAEKNGLTVELGNNEKFIDAFYQVFSHNMHRLGSPVHGKNLFHELSQQYEEKMLVSIVKLDDIVVGAGIILMSHDCAAIPWASTHEKYNKLAPNMLLYWSLLKFVSDNEIKTFDFGRSSYGEGTYKFKKQWGAEPKPLLWRTFVSGSEKVNTTEVGKISSKRVLIENIWRRLPIRLANFIGPKIRKHISL